MKADEMIKSLTENLKWEESTLNGWEMIKTLMENPGWKFKDICGRVAFEENGAIKIQYDGKPSMFDIEEKWELIREPVAFITAYRAWQEGKWVYLDTLCGRRKFKRGGMDCNFDMRYVENGKWFVES